MKKVIIEVSGGVVTNVTTDQEIELIIIDYDIDGLDEESTSVNDMGHDCYMYQGDVLTIDPERVDKISNLN